MATPTFNFWHVKTPAQEFTIPDVPGNTYSADTMIGALTKATGQAVHTAEDPNNNIITYVDYNGLQAMIDQEKEA